MAEDPELVLERKHETESRINELQSRIRAAQTEIAAQRQVLAAKEQAIVTLQSRGSVDAQFSAAIDALVVENADLERLVAERRRQVAAAHQRHQANENQISRLSRGTQRTSIAALTADRDHADQAEARLRRQVADLQRALASQAGRFASMAETAATTVIAVKNAITTQITDADEWKLPSRRPAAAPAPAPAATPSEEIIIAVQASNSMTLNRLMDEAAARSDQPPLALASLGRSFVDPVRAAAATVDSAYVELGRREVLRLNGLLLQRLQELSNRSEEVGRLSAALAVAEKRVGECEKRAAALEQRNNAAAAQAARELSEAKNAAQKTESLLKQQIYDARVQLGQVQQLRRPTGLRRPGK